MNKISISFDVDRDIYNAYKDIVEGWGERVEDNILRYMQRVIDDEIFNGDTMEAIEEIERLKADPCKKTYGSFEELLKELEEE